MILKFSKTTKILIIFLFFDIFCALDNCDQEKKNLDPQLFAGLATKAFLYAYPLVLMDITKKVMTNVKSPEGLFAPVNQFGHTSKFIKSKFNKFNKLEADILYSSAWLDLEKGPIILHVPNTYDRYYLIEVLDNWTNVIYSIGKRTTGTKAQDFIFVGPGFQGDIPKDLKIIKSPTNIVWLIGRIPTKDKEDYKMVNNIQKNLTLRSLSSLGKDYKPENNPNVVDNSIEMNVLPVDQIENMDGVDFFNYFSKLFKKNNPTEEDLNYLKKFNNLFLITGKNLDLKKLTSQEQDLLNAVPYVSLKRLYSFNNSKNKVTNGWNFIKGEKSYGTNYLKRAVIAYYNLGANLIEDEIYAVTKIDSKGRPLEGYNNYIIHFDVKQLPKTKGFWSLTVYNKNLLFVDNIINRYSLNSFSKLKYNPDGSLDIYVQKNQPAIKKSNWLPSPIDSFELILRIYSPEKTMLTGSWKPPLVKRDPDVKVVKPWYRNTFDVITEGAFE